MQGLLNKEGQYTNISIESIYLPPFLINLAQKYSFEEILIIKSVQKNYLQRTKITDKSNTVSYFIHIKCTACSKKVYPNPPVSLYGNNLDILTKTE